MKKHRKKKEKDGIRQIKKAIDDGFFIAKYNFLKQKSCYY